MGILQDALPGLKRFLSPAELKASVLALVIRGVVFSTKRKPRVVARIPREILGRGPIERFFNELESTLGLHPYRFAQFERVEHWIELVRLSFLYLEWYRLQPLRRRDVREKEKRRWPWP